MQMLWLPRHLQASHAGLILLHREQTTGKIHATGFGADALLSGRRRSCTGPECQAFPDQRDRRHAGKDNAFCPGALERCGQDLKLPE